MEAPLERRYQSAAEVERCPVFSIRLEEHLVAVSRGEIPAQGRFCGNCYTPLSADSELCPHCRNDRRLGRPSVDTVPPEVTEMLRRQRSTESRYVTGFAYLGVIIAVLGGLAVVLGVPYLRDHLLAATIVYSIILLIGVRGLAGFLGGYFGDRIGYERARARTVVSWRSFDMTRDRGSTGDRGPT